MKVLQGEKKKSSVSQLQQLDQTSLCMVLQIKIKKLCLSAPKEKRKKNLLPTEEKQRNSGQFDSF